jgi:hypothetical protein
VGHPAREMNDTPETCRPPLGRTGSARTLQLSKEVARMLTGEMAKYRIEDRIREGSSARTGRLLSTRRKTERRARVTRLVGVTAALLPLPFKH